MDPNVIVLILSYNGKHLLDDSISSYLANDYSNFQVVIVDNGSTDNTKEWVNQFYPEVYVLRNEKNLAYSGGFNFGLNYAFMQCNADYVLITNNDVKADSKVITELLKVAERDPMIGFVTGKVYYYDSPNILQTIGYYKDSVTWTGGHIGGREQDTGQFDEDMERFMSDDIFMLVKKTVFLKVGGYNTIFKFQGEQADWQARAKKEGFKIYYAHKAKIWHKESMTIGKASSFKIFYDVRNTLLPALIHNDDIFNRIFFKWYFKNLVLIPLIKYTIKLKISFSFAVFKGFVSAMYYAISHKHFKIKYLF